MPSSGSQERWKVDCPFCDGAGHGWAPLDEVGSNIKWRDEPCPYCEDGKLEVVPASSLTTANQQIEELTRERDRTQDLAIGNYEQACRFRDELIAVEAQRDTLREALDRWLFLALNGVICDPSENPCKDCAEVFERTRLLLTTPPAKPSE